MDDTLDDYVHGLMETMIVFRAKMMNGDIALLFVDSPNDYEIAYWSRKWRRCKNDVVDFYCSLDSSNRNIFAKYISKHMLNPSSY